MTEAKVRSIVQAEMQKNYWGGKPQVAPHNHDGNNALKVNAVNLNYNNKFAFALIANDSGGQAAVTVTSGISNPTAVYLYAIGQNPATGTAVQKASITGNAQLGNVYTLFPPNGVPVKQKDGIAQMNSSSNFDFGITAPGVWTPHVTSDGINLCSVFDEATGSTQTINVKSWTNTSVTFISNITQGSGWLITAHLFIV